MSFSIQILSHLLLLSWRDTLLIHQLGALTAEVLLQVKLLSHRHLVVMVEIRFTQSHRIGVGIIRLTVRLVRISL